MRPKPVHLLAAMLIIAAVYFYQDPQSNGNSRLAVVRAVVERGSFEIDAYQNNIDWATIDKAAYNNHYYTDKGIGSSLLALPAYFILYRLGLLLRLALDAELIKHVLTTLVMGISFVITGLLLYRIAEEIAHSALTAFIATLAVCLGTMLWPYTAVYYGHVPAAMFLTIAFYLLFRMRSGPDGTSRVKLGLAGLAMGLAFITDYTTALIIPGLIAYAVYILVTQDRTKVTGSAIAGGLGAAVPLLVMVAYNLIVYKAPLAFGYSHEATVAFEQGHATGFMGIGMPHPSVLYHILLDPRFGLFWQSPVLLLSGLGFGVAFLKKVYRVETLLAAYSIGIIMLMNAGFYMWWGGSAFGPRLLIVALPFFIVPLALVPNRLNWLLGGLTVLSAAQMLIPLLGKIQTGLNYDADLGLFTGVVPFNGISILYQYGIPTIFHLYQKGTLPWNLGAAMGLPYAWSVVVLAGIEAALAAWMWRLVKRSATETQSLGEEDLSTKSTK